MKYRHLTLACCPMRWHLSSAWIMIAGVQNNSVNHTVDDAVKVTATPAAFVWQTVVAEQIEWSADVCEKSKVYSWYLHSQWFPIMQFLRKDLFGRIRFALDVSWEVSVCGHVVRCKWHCDEGELEYTKDLTAPSILMNLVELSLKLLSPAPRAISSRTSKWWAKIQSLPLGKMIQMSVPIIYGIYKELQLPHLM